MTSDEKVLAGLDWQVVDEPNMGDGSLPWVTHSGAITIGDVCLRAYTLNDGRRIFDADDINKFFETLAPKGDAP